MSSPKLQSRSIVVDDRGTELSYIDTGAPLQASKPYTTIFGVHGMSFNAGIFMKVQALAADANIRFVGINRCDYPGSTAYSSEELAVINSGSEAKKDNFLKARGVELLTFIDEFIQSNNLPVMTSDHKSSRVVILGWSLGCSVTLSAIANVATLPINVRERLASRIHTMIMHEPGSNILGIPPDPRNWVPWNLIDPTIPVDAEMPFFAEWISGYFQHGDLSTRNRDVLNFMVHDISRPPTVFNMSKAEYASIVETGTIPKVDIPYQINFFPQLLASYRKANYDKPTRQLLPNMHNFYLGGEKSPVFGLLTVWLVQDDDEMHRGGFVNASIIEGVNHISPWDDPSKTLQAYLDCISG